MNAGCSGLGVLVVQGRGVGKDEARAIVLFTKACDMGSGLGCYNLGNALVEGIGAPRDKARAAALFAKACKIDGAADSCARAETASK